ncbi:antitoxin [Thiorhodococcus mannitoliphagus]|uniref:Antitoxin n=2 Tax=Thiorhodococcus mannitoliphagus TaxID=329406 RepID=A0A6P1DZU8_9GAMM|nr:antitoxin [Thiorhodococcus mannitoliphagus]
MRDHDDFSKMKGRKNPFIKQLTQPVTMHLDVDTMEYFQSLAEEMGIPYGSVIDVYRRDCAIHRRKLPIE